MIVFSERRCAAAVLTLLGIVDFEARGAFRDAYEPWLAVPEIREIHVDLDGVQRLDASVPGMLLLLRERARAAGKRFIVSNAQPPMREALTLASLLD
jgi:anti-anti-sigma factor